ncbi:uncharacterized protein LOC106672167 isoform X2 [Cimex lectularius]|uniref:Serine/threonine-protein kinase 11-interacting protein n=1 Tax=Cimex lectularius TaxID=79782 RepID=A0A8I6TK25_CIMLE|nr:uncharacterized protein LOC106672167 isoform X2 [Cimex lectularius]
MENELETVLRLMVHCLSKRADLLSGKNTLVLQTPLLFRFNRFLDVLECEHSDVILTDGQRKELESFQVLLAKIPRLSLTQRSVEAFAEEIDLSRFEKLTSLELRNVSVSKLKGSQIKSQLQELVTNNCADEEYFSKKGKLQWASLNKFHFKFRYFEGLNLGFLNSMPWLQELNLSHNNLKECNALANLTNLVYLNLGFNRLTKIPKLHDSTKNKLKVFLIDHNFLSDLTGLENMTKLTDLDLSWNWIASKFKLLSLVSLVSLQQISMKNNPFSHNDFYRIYIASSICSKYPKFSIDDVKLNTNEKSVFGSAIISKNDAMNQSGEIDAILDPDLIEKPVKIIKAKRRSKPREMTISSLCDPEAMNQEKTNINKKDAEVNKKIMENVIPDKTELLENLKEEINDELLAGIKNVAEDKKIEISQSKAECEPKTCNSSPDDREIFTQTTTTAILHTPAVVCSDIKSQSVETEINKNDNLETEKKSCDHFKEQEHDLGAVQVNGLSENVQSDSNIDTERNSHLEQIENSSHGVQTTDENVQSDSNEDTEHDSNLEQIENNFSQGVEKIDQYGQEFSSNDETNINEDKEQYLDASSNSLAESQNKSNQDTTEENSDTPIAHTSEEASDEDTDDDDCNVHDELMWQVQIFDKATATSRMVFLILLEKELKERCTKSGKIITRWNLDSIRSCVKTEMNPIKIELEFDSTKKSKQHRCYIMEFPDAQSLMKRLYDILESKALTDMDQGTYSCLKCTTVFVHIKKSKEIKCTICGSYEVAEIEEPRLPNKKIPSKQAICHSPSESSIGSAVSLDQPRHPSFSKRYESDVEILSNPSQSSIEVIDDQSRSQSTTPSRKKSSEERQTVAVPQLGTVLEVIAPLSALTESSSSDAHVKTEPEQADIYSYTDFRNVDQRIETYLRNSLFTSEKEELRVFVRSHVWKTGGSDYDGCFVLSSSFVYFLYHSNTDFSEPECNWLAKSDSYRCEQMKYITPLFKNEGIEIKINNITYLLLLLDENVTKNLLNSIKNLNLSKLKVAKKWNPQIDVSLKQAVVSCELSSSCLDPTVNYFTIFKRIQIIKNKVDEEVMRLGSLVVTPGQLYLIPGDLSWLSSCNVPAIHSCQELLRLKDIERNKFDSLSLHFLGKEGIEEVWNFTLKPAQIVAIANCIKIVSKRFSKPLEIPLKS